MLWIFLLAFFPAKWPRKIHEKIQDKIHGENQTPRPTMNLREAVSLKSKHLFKSKGPHLSVNLPEYKTTDQKGNEKMENTRIMEIKA